MLSNHPKNQCIECEIHIVPSAEAIHLCRIVRSCFRQYGREHNADTFELDETKVGSANCTPNSSTEDMAPDLPYLILVLPEFRENTTFSVKLKLQWYDLKLRDMGPFC